MSISTSRCFINRFSDYIIDAFDVVYMLWGKVKAGMVFIAGKTVIHA